MLCLMALTAGTVKADDMIILTKKQYSKTIEKSFDISRNGEVAIVNQYGSIDMHTWDKNEVQLTVTIVVNATSQSAAEDVFEKINIHFDNAADRVLAETIINKEDKAWWNWGSSIKSDFEINYKLYMPISCSVDFNNKYGNINMMDLENHAKITARYGDLTMGDLEGDLELYLGYGNAFTGSLKDVKGEIEFSKFRCEAMNDFLGQSKYSQMIINRGGRLVAESKYDNYQLGNIKAFINEGKYDNILIEACEELVIETKYTDVKMGSLSQKLVAELSYGGIKVNELLKGFDKVMVESAFANLTFGLAQDVAMDVELVGKYINVNIPKSSIVKDEQDGSSRTVKAAFGSKGSRGNVQLEMEYGELKMQ